MSEQKAEQTSGEPGSLSGEPAVPNSSDMQIEPVEALAQPPIDADAPTVVPAPSAAGTPQMGVPKSEAPKSEAPKAETSKAETSKAEAGKVMIMLSGNRGWDDTAAGPKAESEANRSMFANHRRSALAAMVALAAITGALGGAMATSGLGHFFGNDATRAGQGALEASVARIDADIQALKASVEHTSKIGMSQFNKTSDRLDKVERAQVEPAAKLARLSEAIDKLRAAPVAPAAVAAAPVVPKEAAKEVTASVTPAVTAPAAPAAAPRTEVAKLPDVEGWVLRDVAYGGALIQSRRGVYEVYAGDAVPGLGRVDAIRKQDGRWVVVTTKGLIAAR
jgi:hypothetical protein